jgi:hypothetical protein
MITLPKISGIREKAPIQCGGAFPIIPLCPILPEIPRVPEFVGANSRVGVGICVIRKRERSAGIVIITRENHRIVCFPFSE